LNQAREDGQITDECVADLLRFIIIMHDTFRLLDCDDDSKVGLHNYVHKEDMWYPGDIDDDFWKLLQDNL
jgi:hypothetical protein